MLKLATATSLGPVLLYYFACKYMFRWLVNELPILETENLKRLVTLVILKWSASRMDANISNLGSYSSVHKETLFIGLAYLLQVFACGDNF